MPRSRAVDHGEHSSGLSPANQRLISSNILRRRLRQGNYKLSRSGRTSTNRLRGITRSMPAALARAIVSASTCETNPTTIADDLAFQATAASMAPAWFKSTIRQPPFRPRQGGGVAEQFHRDVGGPRRGGDPARKHQVPDQNDDAAAGVRMSRGRCSGRLGHSRVRVLASNNTHSAATTLPRLRGHGSSTIIGYVLAWGARLRRLPRLPRRSARISSPARSCSSAAARWARRWRQCRSIR